MAKNADEQVDDDDRKVTEEDLRKAKYGEDDEGSSEETDDESEDDGTNDDSEETGDDDGKTDDETEDDDSEEEDTTDSDDDDSEFVKEFPNIKGDTVEDYARSLESTLRESSNEGKRIVDENKALKAENESLKATGGDKTDKGDKKDPAPVDPQRLYLDRLINNDAQTVFAEFKKSYPQADPDTNPVEYARFEAEVAALSGYYLSKNQILTANELYPRVADILGWKPATNKVDSKDKLNIALKGRAAVPKTASSAKPGAKKSKVTEQMLAVNRMMYPNKTDAEIIKELEPHVK